jgi:hypothetical protein
MAVKLHRCSTKWKVGPCWRVQKALDQQGIEYEVVKGPARPGKRVELQRLSGQKLYPVIEFEDGSIYREESRDMGRDDPCRKARREAWGGRLAVGPTSSATAAPARHHSQLGSRSRAFSRVVRPLQGSHFEPNEGLAR